MATAPIHPSADFERDAFASDAWPTPFRSELLLALCAVTWALWGLAGWVATTVLLSLRARPGDADTDRDL